MTVTSIARFAAHAVLALTVAGAASISFAGPITTRTLTEAQIPGGKDVDSSSTGNSESYVEAEVGSGKWTASSLAETSGNLEVGVTTTRTYTNATAAAYADLALDRHFDTGDAVASGVRFTVQPSELLFRPGVTDPLAGGFDGVLGIDLKVQLNGRTIGGYFFQMEVKSVDGGIDITSGSSGTALVHLIEVLSGNWWGVRLEGFSDVIALTPAIYAGDDITVLYSMSAQARVSPGDQNYSFSAKIGDPLDALGGGAIEFITESVPNPGVPEPSSAWLLVVALAAARRASGRRSGPAVRQTVSQGRSIKAGATSDRC